MFNTLSSRVRIALASVLVFGSIPGYSQQAMPLAEAMSSVGRYLGPQSLEALITVEGQRGMPQPLTWEFRFADAASQNGIQVVTANTTRTLRKASMGEGYPMVIPASFFSASSVKIDNIEAFKIADIEAKKAMLGFDSVHYLLRARDGTNKPVWHLTLIDIEGRPVGRLEIAATNGKVERQVWLRYESSGRRELIRIEDSASPLVALQASKTLPTSDNQGAMGYGGAGELLQTTPGSVPPPAITPPPAPPTGGVPPPAPTTGGYIPLPP